MTIRRIRRTMGQYAALLTGAVLVALVSGAWPGFAETKPSAPAAAGAAQSAAQKPEAAPSKKKADPAKAAAPANTDEKTDKTAARSSSSTPRRAGGEQAIVALVNDEPITNYEVQQRQRLAGLGANIQGKAQANFKALIQRKDTTDRLKEILNETIKANQGKSKEEIIQIFEGKKKQFAMGLQKQAIESARSSVLPGLRQNALDELIEERLKLQEAKRMNVLAGDDEVDKIVTSMAERNKMTLPQFGQHLAGMGADIETMKTRIRASMSWNDVIRRRFGQQVLITERDVDRMVAAVPVAPDEDVSLSVQRIKIVVPEKIEQVDVAKRMQDAEAIRAKFKDCKSMASLTTGVAGASFDNLGDRKPEAIQEPTRSMLLAANDGEMLPPTVGENGIEIFALCGRKTLKAAEETRSAAQNELRQKEFDILAKRHLKDLRNDALIEYR